MHKPHFLVGSSTESLHIAKALKEMLSDDVDVTLWNEGFFTPGEYALETLLRKAATFDGALVVGAADDRLVFRGDELDSIRDNLLIEFGLFVAVFGRRKALLLLESDKNVKIPSDLAGLNYLTFTRTTPAENGLADAVAAIRLCAADFASEVVGRDTAEYLEKLAQAFLWELQRAMGLTSELGLHVWLVDARATPPVMARVSRARNSARAQKYRVFEMPAGIVGACSSSGSYEYVDLAEPPYCDSDEAAWLALGPSTRKGMDFELLVETRSRFRFVAAAPIVASPARGGELLGCISCNVGRAVTSPTAQLQSLETSGVLERAAEMARIVLEVQGRR